MGQTLSEPVTTKNTAFCQDQNYRVGSSSMQGWRINMEDSHTHILSLPDDPSAAFFGVFDGHGGAKISEYAGKHLHKFVVKRPEYKEGNVTEALEQGFLDIDKAMLEDDELKHEQSGTTAITVMIKDNVLYCANVGDSRAVACVAGRVEGLSMDHKPNKRKEYDRITAAGGFVEFNRVNGNLALSRALGDFNFKRNKSKNDKEQIVTAYPEVKVCPLEPDWEFVVIACDGIWDVMSNYEVVQYVRKHIASGMEPEEICENLMTICLAPDCQMAGLGCDNMTVVIICFLHGDTYENLSVKISNRLESDKTKNVSSFEHYPIVDSNFFPGEEQE